MNKKGFTLIELIATIVIISVLALVAVVSVSGIMKKTTERAYKNIEEAMQTAAQNYILKGNGIGVITSETLVDGGFLEKPIDPKTKKICSLKKSYVNVSKEEVSETVNEKYNYNVCLICGDYKSEYCKDKTTIKLSYRYSENEDENSVNNYKEISGTILMKPGSNIQIKYEIEFETENNIELKFEDSDCEKSYQKIISSNNTFRIVNTKELDKECSVKVWDTSDESVLKPSYFTIKNEKTGNDNILDGSTNKLELYIGGYANVGVSENTYDSSFLEFKKLEEKRLKFRILNEGKVDLDSTKDLHFQLINNTVVDGDKKFNCFAIKPKYGSYVLENSIKGYVEVDNTSICLKNITDGCDNVKLRVLKKIQNENETTGEKTSTYIKIKDYSLDYPSYKHITYFSIDKKYVEIDGKYDDSSQVLGSYYTQNIDYEPLDADNNNFICEVINGEKYNDSVSCQVIGSGKEKSLKIMGGIKPISSGEYATVKLYPEDGNSNVEPINIRVKVNNVVPTSVSISYRGGTQIGYLYSYMCSGKNQQNIIRYSTIPSNAMVSSSIIELLEPEVGDKLIRNQPCTIPQAFKLIDNSSAFSPVFNNDNICDLKIKVTVYNSYGNKTESVSSYKVATVYPRGYSILSKKYCY